MRSKLSEIELPELRTADLVGKWHIVRTTFPMWQKVKIERPTLNYASIPGSDSKLEDLVIYERRGAQKRIRGVDVQDPELSCHFCWRGSGVLSLLSSEWYVVDFDRRAGIMAIYFCKTLLTPAGLDVATRSPSPTQTLVDACLARLRPAAVLRPLVDALVELRH